MLTFFKQLFQQLKFKAMARQLRKPGGPFGNKVGLMMNKANEFLYGTTLAEMNIVDNNSILEIGFGNGAFFHKIFVQANNINVTGIDYSLKMVREAKERNAASLATGRLNLLQANSNQLPFAAASFDKIFCINVIYFWDSPSTHLAAIKRVLKPGGRFYTTIRTKESMQQMPFTKYNFSMYTETEWIKLLEDSQLQFVSAKIIEEPTVDFNGNPFTISSLCIIAEKGNAL
jgi:ubiquinone/menaquinone biosynthesis C-methylase UbiE